MELKIGFFILAFVGFLAFKYGAVANLTEEVGKLFAGFSIGSMVAGLTCGFILIIDSYIPGVDGWPTLAIAAMISLLIVGSILLYEIKKPETV